MVCSLVSLRILLFNEAFLMIPSETESPLRFVPSLLPLYFSHSTTRLTSPDQTVCGAHFSACLLLYLQQLKLYQHITGTRYTYCIKHCQMTSKDVRRACRKAKMSNSTWQLKVEEVVKHERHRLDDEELKGGHFSRPERVEICLEARKRQHDEEIHRPSCDGFPFPQSKWNHWGGLNRSHMSTFSVLLAMATWQRTDLRDQNRAKAHCEGLTLLSMEWISSHSEDGVAHTYPGVSVRVFQQLLTSRSTHSEWGEHHTMGWGASWVPACPCLCSTPFLPHHSLNLSSRKLILLGICTQWQEKWPVYT